ncbi:unnamed protein product [Urochloa humidicola]
MAAPPPSFTVDGSDNAPEAASTYEARVHTGAHQLRISTYSAAEEIAAGGGSGTITSDEFTVGGHRWAISYYPDGFWASECRGYVSVFLSHSSSGAGRTGADGVRVAAEIGLVDRERCAVAHAREFSHAFRRRGESWGFRQFLRRADLAASECLAGDCVVVRCVVRVVEEEVVAGEGAVASVRVPPPELGRDLGRALFRDGVGTDVTLVVGGRAFRAHRCVLAARSPVLRAGLYGAPMREATEGVIEVHEMDPMVFAAMLHFIHTDTLPPETAADDAGGGVNMAQHLLAAADRYALGRLSLVCQDRLARHVDTGTVAATYALASQHGVPELKAAVVEFMARRRGRTEAVTASDGFRRLEREDPAIAEEMVSRAVAAMHWRATWEVPASCPRFAVEACRSCVMWLAGVWACFVRLLEMSCAYMREREAPFDIDELPEIIDGVITLYHGMKWVLKKIVKYCIYYVSYR